MQKPLPSTMPTNLEEAVDTLIAFYEKDLPAVKAQSEEEFKSSSHYAVGMFIRSTWYLWWYEGHPYDNWPMEQYALVKWF
ncbi:MAG: hypothetical protein EOP45_19820 [Sphingobacteriaceae bacterium]|nr:MAG: hypothetical protein EOP45_19820 [Sphingobacteriaceae bacterium]